MLLYEDDDSNLGTFNVHWLHTKESFRFDQSIELAIPNSLLRHNPVNLPIKSSKTPLSLLTLLEQILLHLRLSFALTTKKELIRIMKEQRLG